MKVLIAGMSGTGKSSVVAALCSRGYRAFDLDDDGWSEWVPCDGNPTGANPGHDWLWNETRLTHLLDVVDNAPLFVSGCAPNMGRFAPRFNHIVLLSAPLEVLLARVAHRDTNVYGKTGAERDRIAANLDAVEPALRRMATQEIDATRPLESVVDDVLEVLA